MTHLILGGPGRTGSRIIDRLTSSNQPIRSASRGSGFDWDDPSTWAGTLDGARTAYVCFSPDLAFPGVPDRMEHLGTLAAGQGLERLVLLSGRGEEGARASEAALRAGGLPTTVLRCSWFQQNFSEHFLTGPVRRGRLRLPARDVPEAFVDLDDVADAAVVALTSSTPMDDTFELSGPHLLTFADVAQTLGTARGSEVLFESVDVDQFVADIAADGIPHEVVESLAHLFTEILDGRNASTTDGVQRLLNRPPSPFGAYALRTAATGVWG